MADERWTGQADRRLRLAGLVLCVVAGAAIRRLAHLPGAGQPGWAAGFSAYGWAATGIVGASGGGMLAVLGAHLFDRIEVAARWRGHRCLGDGGVTGGTGAPTADGGFTGLCRRAGDDFPLRAGQGRGGRGNGGRTGRRRIRPVFLRPRDPAV